MGPREEKRLFYVSTTPPWNDYKPFWIVAVLSNPVFAYKASTMVDWDEVRTAGRKRDVFLRASIADHDVMVVLPFLGRA